MRTLLATLASIAILCTTATAQTKSPAAAPAPYYSFSPLWQPFLLSAPVTNIDFSNRKWQVRPYASVSAGVIFYNGATSYLSAPVGVILARPLNNNWAAFGAVTAAP